MILSLFFVFGAPLHAGEKATVSYSKGLLAFSDSDYSKALQFFQEAYLDDPKLADNLYFLALTHLRSGHFAEAAKYFGELIQKNPEFTKAHYDYALSLFHQGNTEEALKWFKKVPSGDSFAAEAKEWIAKIEKGEKPTGPKATASKKEGRWKLSASSSFFFDSNVVSDPDNETLTGTGGYQADIMGTGAVDIQFSPVLRDTAKFSLFYSGYQQGLANLQVDMNRLNYGRHRAGFNWIKKLSPRAQLRMPVYYAFVSQGKTKYLDGGTWASTFDLAWKKRWVTSITGEIRGDDFFATPANSSQLRDAWHYSLRFEHYFLPGEANLFFKLGYEFSHNVADGGDWDYFNHRAIVSFGGPFIWKSKILVSNNIDVFRHYFHGDSVFGVFRRDSILQSSVTLTRGIIPHLDFSVNYTFIVDNANISRYTYKRHVMGLTLTTYL